MDDTTWMHIKCPKLWYEPKERLFSNIHTFEKLTIKLMSRVFHNICAFPTETCLIGVKKSCEVSYLISHQTCFFPKL